MFVITFYSYKGGVGRTMALVNTAAELTKRGRRVLVIDFDLEAPGISTYDPFINTKETLGIVDYVSSFIATSHAPKASDFITKCDLPIGDQLLPVWAFSAGRQDEQYGVKLASIDWQDLYVNKNGYLLFEDLKQQLKADERQFDYILVDSRTGHTDVGGICTRQLADVVLLMFFPNQQNIHGLSSIASEIRADSDARDRGIDLLYVPSNIPDLDDEDGILKRMMDIAKERLEYDDPSVIIHHYDSLSLLDQRIFTINRPNSRLSEEYRSLVTSIIELNAEDREGALAVLQRAREYLEDVSHRGQRRVVLRDAWLVKALSSLDKMGRIHSSDGDVMWALAAVYQSLGNLSNELNALNDALKAGHSPIKVRLRRAQNLMSQSKQADAKADLLYVISAEGIGAIELMSAIEALRTLEAQWFLLLDSSPALADLRPTDVLMLTDILMSELGSLPTAKRILTEAITKKSGEATKRTLENQLALVLIGLGDFLEALEFIGADRSTVVDSDDTPTIFNYAMAEWGFNKNPPYDMIKHLIALDGQDSDLSGANYLQCLAICYALCNEVETASEYVNRAKKSLGPGKIFSSWKYLYVDRDVMMSDLDEMAANLSPEILPEFLRKAKDRRLVH